MHLGHPGNFIGSYNFETLQVPVGFHVNLKFTHFDIEASEECVNDFVQVCFKPLCRRHFLHPLYDHLQISEEHSARANEPLGEYFFLFEDEEKKPPMCGIVTPPQVEVTSNRMRINFTSNSRVNAKGFRAEWSAGMETKIAKFLCFRMRSCVPPESLRNCFSLLPQ